MAMVKMSLLQSRYGLSDPELARQVGCRPSLIRGLEAITVSVYASRVDLSLSGKVAYLDDAYFLDVRGVSAAVGS